MIELTTLPSVFDACALERHPFEGMDVADLLLTVAKGRGDAPFLVWDPVEGEGCTWSYAAFVEDAARFAGALNARGVRPRDAVLIHLDNCPEFLIAYYGCAIAGAVAVTTNTRSSLDELRYYADHSGVVAAVTQPCFHDLVRRAAPNLSAMAVTATAAGQPPPPAFKPAPR